jgi:hypothetical protein
MDSISGAASNVELTSPNRKMYFTRINRKMSCFAALFFVCAASSRKPDCFDSELSPRHTLDSFKRFLFVGLAGHKKESRELHN